MTRVWMQKIMTQFSSNKKQDNVWLYDKCFKSTNNIGMVDNANFLISPLIEIPQNSEFTFQAQISINSPNGARINEYDKNGNALTYWNGGVYQGNFGGYPTYKRTINKLWDVKSKYIRVSISKNAYQYCKVWIGDKLVFDGAEYPPKPIISGGY